MPPRRWSKTDFSPVMGLTECCQSVHNQMRNRALVHKLVETDLFATWRDSLYHCRNTGAALALAIAGLTPTTGNAYTAAGDRNFPATLILPQVHLEDFIYGTFSAQPTTSGSQTQFAVTYNKAITERLSLQLADGLTRLGSVTGAQNFTVLLQYETIIDQLHEFLLSFQVEHEVGGTGSQQVQSPRQNATTPAVLFAKGLGDLPIGYWRPLAITGFAGYQAAQGARNNQVQAGFSIQYSIPYLLSKVANVDLPPLLRGMTPIVEVMYTTTTRGQGTTLQVAPGISYSRGRGWEFGVEAMIPTNKATGTGRGVIAQLVVQLDYLLPDNFFGRPILPVHEPR